MAEDSQDFDPWLCERLQELKTDESIFGPYITSILEGDEDEEEKIEALDGLLAELGSNLDVESLRNEILKRWKQSVSSSSSASTKSSGAAQLSNGLGDGDGNSSKTLESKSEVGKDSEESLLVNKMESFFKLSEEQNKAASSSSSSAKLKGDIGADSALRAAILSQYSANDSSEGEEEADGDSKSKGLGGVAKNVNAEKVAAEQRELKEKSRADHAKKKERDKEDRNKQKQAQQDRKEKAKKKSQKVERKR